MLSCEDPSWRADQTCSYCGSLSPEEFFKAVEAGAKLTPTDKNYKAYLEVPGRPFTKFYFNHLSEEEQRRFIDLVNAGKVTFGYPGRFYNLPFFMARKE
jgi:hypothetical protein